MNNAPTRRERDSRDFLEWLTGPDGVSLAAVEARMREQFSPAQPVREYLAPINHAQQYEPPEVDDDYDGPDGSPWSWDR